MTAGPDGAARLPAPAWIAARDLPACLDDLPEKQRLEGLWALGDANILATCPDRCVAIVGTREASPYGIRTATRLATAAAKAGLTVISGLARGVDAAAHRAALEAGGKTIGVQGPGVDVPYPVGHRALHARVAQDGLVLGEMEPGTRPFAGCFPRRNRIIAALAKVTIVVEAGFKSGAINTASQALDLGRTVGGVPGSIDDPRSAGVNVLLRDGSQVITSVEDMLGLYQFSTFQETGEAANVLAGDEELTEADRILLQLLEGNGVSAGDFAYSVGMPYEQVTDWLARLEMAGVVENDGGLYRKRV